MNPFALNSDFLNYIIKQGYAPGDRLPPISDLADDEHLGISISKVREQLEVARALGIVEVRSKTGMRVKEYTFTPAVRLSLFYALACNATTFEAFSTLRTHIEVAFWHEACALLTESEIRVMQNCIEQARRKLNSHPIHIPNFEHRTFHLTLFNGLENPFVNGILEAYWDAYDAFAVHRYMDYDYLQRVWDYHETILDHICSNHYDDAQQAFIEHTRLLRYQLDLES